MNRRVKSKQRFIIQSIRDNKIHHGVILGVTDENLSSFVDTGLDFLSIIKLIDGYKKKIKEEAQRKGLSLKAIYRAIEQQDAERPRPE